MKKLTITLIALGVMGCESRNATPYKQQGVISSVYSTRSGCIATVFFPYYYTNANSGKYVSYKVSCNDYKVGDKVKLIKQ